MGKYQKHVNDLAKKRILARVKMSMETGVSQLRAAA
jgi:hypothetical protein